MIAPNANDDSFWMRMDNDSWVKWNNIASGSSWHWDEVHNTDNNGQVMNYNLGSGSHTLTVAYREDGTQLDKIYITNTDDTPSGEGSAATNCSGSGEEGTIVVRARGNTGSESIELRLNDNTVQTWRVTTSYQSFSYNTSLSSANIKVYFDDAGGGSNDVQIDYIQVNSTTLQAEDQATNTGVWQDGGCGGSYAEWIHCEGYIDFGTVTIINNKVVQEETATQVQVFPTEFVLGQNYPNPFNLETTIDYEISNDSRVIIKVYDVQGILIRTLVNQHQSDDQHTVSWNATDDSGNLVTTGVYFYKIRIISPNNMYTQTKKMILMK